MTARTMLARTETKLYLRDPLAVLLAVAMPAAVLAGLGAVPAPREPSDTFGGLRFIEYFAPSLLAVSIAISGLQNLPIGLATYREKGILRRLSATPMRCTCRSSCCRTSSCGSVSSSRRGSEP